MYFKFFKNIRSVFLFVFSVSTVHLYPYVIKGFVVNEVTREAIANVNISVLNSNKGTITDSDGRFTLNFLKGNDVLHFSYVGFDTFEMQVSSINDDSLIITLRPSLVQLDKNLVVTATKVNTTPFDSPDAVFMLTSTDIRNNAPRSTAEALIGTTGVWVQKTNHGGGSPFIRGLTGNQTLLLVDGIRLNNATFRYGPNQYFNTLDLHSIEKIEVVRGKGSVLYGSDALGGVINLVTRSPNYLSGQSEIKSALNLKYMSHDMEYSSAGEMEYHSEKMAILGNVNYKKFGDIYSGKLLGFERPSGYSEYGTNIKAKFRIKDNWQITSAFYLTKQMDVHRYDQIVRGYSLYKFDPQIHHLAYTKIEYYHNNPVLTKINFLLSRQSSDETRKIQKNDSAILHTENDKVNTYGLLMDINSQFSEKWNSVTGIEYYFDFVKSIKKETDYLTENVTVKRGLYPNNSRMSNFAFFSQHTLQLNDFRITMGGRVNAIEINSYDEEFGDIRLNASSLVGNVSMQYFMTPAQQLNMSAYSAFRAPNISDVSSFGLFDYGIEMPSPSLSPEKAYTIETGYKVSNKTISIAASLFHIWLDNQILRVKSDYNGQQFIDGEQVYKKLNIDRSRLVGFEFESALHITNQIKLLNNFTLLHGENVKTRKPMGRIPPMNGKTALRFNRSAFFGEIEWLYAGKQDRLSDGDKEDHRIPEGGTPGWNILNLKGGFYWKENSLNVGFNNLFDKPYRIHGSGIDGYGRSFWITLSFEKI